MVYNCLQIDSKITLDKATIKLGDMSKLFSEGELDRIGQYCWDGWQSDVQSRDPWFRRMEAAMDLAMQIQKDKSFPWAGASNVVFPLISIAALQFSARAYGNLIGPDLVTYVILTGEADDETLQRAERLGCHMTFQCLTQDTAWEEQHDRLLINLAIVGTTFIKSRYDNKRRHNVGELVLARDLVVNYWSKDLASSPRVSQEIEMTRNDAITMIRQDSMRDVEDESWFQAPPPVTTDTSQKNNRWGFDPNYKPDSATPLQLVEQHANIDLDCDGYAEPYIITFDRYSRKVLRIVLNCDRIEDIERNDKGKIIEVRKTEYFTKYSFIPAPDGGFYDTGFGILMGPLNESVNTAINQLFDAGTIANLGGGFLGRGAKMKAGQLAFKPGEWKNVDATGDDLRKSMIPLPAPNPSPVLFQLLSLLIEYTNLLAGSTDTVLGKNPGQNTPAETSRNMTESGLQIYSTIFKRVWRSMKEEFRKYHILNAKFLPLVTIFGQGQYRVTRDDYLTNPDWVRPAADPNVVSASQKFEQAMSIRQAALSAPGGYDLEAVEKNFLRAMRVENMDELFPGYQKFPPGTDPKVQIEQMKVQISQADQELEQWKFVKEWQEAVRLNTGKIDLLQAQAASLFAGIKSDERAAKLAAYEAFIASITAHNDHMTEKLRLMMDMMEKRDNARQSAAELKAKTAIAGVKQIGKSNSPGSPSSGVPRLARVPTGGSPSPSAKEMAGGDAGPVGIGLPGGLQG